jgi:hypothetical protein
MLDFVVDKVAPGQVSFHQLLQKIIIIINQAINQSINHRGYVQ